MKYDLEKSFAGRRALITGGLGFIGSNLAHRLHALGAEVVVVDSLIPEYGGNLFNLAGLDGRVKVNICDLRDEHAIRCLVKAQDYIFNLAAQVSHLGSIEDPVADLEINARAQVTLLETCRHDNPGVKIVFAGTRQIYGRPRYLPVDEKHPVAPVDPNGISKSAGESYHLLYSRIHKLQTCSLRLTNTYGPRMRVIDARQTFLGWWCRQIIEGEQIRVFGDGEQLRDLNYVDDVVDAFLLAAASPMSKGEVYNLGADPISLRCLAAMLVELAGSGSFQLIPFPPERKAIDIGDYRGDYRKITAALGWKPRITLREGLQRTLDYYRQHRKHYW